MRKGPDYYIVEGGHDADPDPEQLGRVRLRKMSAHGQGVLTEHLPFSQLSSPAGGMGQLEFNRPPAPGTVVLGFDAGESVGYAFPIGIPHGKHESAPSMAGNDALPFLPKAKQLQSKAMGIVGDIQSKIDSNPTGISKFTKELKEKGEKFKQSQYDGVQTHGAPFPLTGIRNLPVEKIQTALDQAMNAMDASKISGLGQNFNLGSLMGGLNGGAMGMDSKMSESLGAMSKLMPQDIINQQPEWGSMIGGLTDPSSLLSSLQSKLTGAGNFGELMNGLKGAQTPEFIAEGAKNLSKTMNISTPFGNIAQTIGADGNISSASDIVEKALQAILGMLGGILQGGPGETLFGQQGTQITELTGRMKDMTKQQNLFGFMEQLSNQNKSKSNGRVNGTENGNTQASRQKVMEEKIMNYAEVDMTVPFYPKTPTTAIA